MKAIIRIMHSADFSQKKLCDNIKATYASIEHHYNSTFQLVMVQLQDNDKFREEIMKCQGSGLLVVDVPGIFEVFASEPDMSMRISNLKAITRSALVAFSQSIVADINKLKDLTRSTHLNKDSFSKLQARLEAVLSS